MSQAKHLSKRIPGLSMPQSLKKRGGVIENIIARTGHNRKPLLVGISVQGGEARVAHKSIVNLKWSFEKPFFT
jgi:hypothetical protein